MHLMGDIRKSSNFIKECLVDSLFLLMENKPYQSIKVIDVCDKAGVGRTSYYRYFKDNDDVILYAFISMWVHWCDVHAVKERKKFTLDNSVTFFSYNLSIKNRLDLVYKNKLDYILLKSFDDIMNEEDAVHNYESSFYGHGLFGLLKEWWRRDFKESPEEMSDILKDFIGDKLIIGKFCAIAKGVEFVMNGANHRMDCATTYPFYIMGGDWGSAMAPVKDELPLKGDTVIGNDVWIGQNVTVMPGVHVGDGAIIGANSVVAKDIPPYSIAVGNPCRVVRKRFDDELIGLLLQFKWWDKSIEEIETLMPILSCGDMEIVRNEIKSRL